MPERFMEMRIFTHVYKCDKAPCTGTMVPTGEPGLAPGSIMYRCPRCRDTKSMNKQFPNIFHVEDGIPLPPDFRKMIADAVGEEEAARLDVYGTKKVLTS